MGGLSLMSNGMEAGMARTPSVSDLLKEAMEQWVADVNDAYAQLERRAPMDKLDTTKPVIWNDGRPARIIATDINGPDGYRIAATRQGTNGIETVCLCRWDGSTNASFFLINAKRRGFIVIGPKLTGGGFQSSSIYESEDDAKRVRDAWGNGRTVVPVEW
jgi:hypothetical protein